MGGARDRDEIVGALDFVGNVASGVQKFALDLGQRPRIVAEQFYELVAVAGLGRLLVHGAPFSQTSRLARNCSMPIGLMMKPSMPTARLLCCWSSSVLAVPARIGVRGLSSGGPLVTLPP